MLRPKREGGEIDNIQHKKEIRKHRLPLKSEWLTSTASLWVDQVVEPVFQTDSHYQDHCAK